MGLWSGIKYALNSRLGTSTFKSLDKLIDDVQAKANDTYVQAQYANANAYEVVARGTVKNVQRGTIAFSIDVSSSSGYSNVTISAVNTSKSILIFSYRDNQDRFGNGAGISCMGNLSTSTNINFQYSGPGANYPSGTIAWQVIEFY